MFRKKRALSVPEVVPNEFLFSQLTPPFEKVKSDNLSVGCAWTMFVSLLGTLSSAVSAVGYFLWKFFQNSAPASLGDYKEGLPQVMVIGFLVPFVASLILYVKEKLQGT